jgi:hypothetical protein
MMQGNVPLLLHSIGKQGIAERRKNADAGQYQILAESHKA